MSLLVMLILLVLFIALSSWSIWHLWRWSIMPNPSNPAVLKQMDALMRSSGLNPKQQRLVDCGSGLGLALWRLKGLGWSRLIGYEGSWLVWAASQLICLFTKLPRKALKRGDWVLSWSEDRTKEDILFFYISPQAMVAADQYLRLLPPDQPVWIITHTFALRGYFPIKTCVVKGLYHTPIYLYRLDGRGVLKHLPR